MRWAIAILLGVLLLASFSFKDEDDVITWNKERKLTWKDYRGKPKPRFAAASTVYSLGRRTFEEKGKIYAKISAYFYCNDSWKKDDWINDEVLAHEQKHFDIVELYARKLRKAVRSLTYTDLASADAKVDSLYKVFNKEMDVYQDQYDNETDGSMNGEGQRRWNKKIDEEIDQLNAYSEMIFVIGKMPG